MPVDESPPYLAAAFARRDEHLTDAGAIRNCGHLILDIKVIRQPIIEMVHRQITEASP
jgi:hypothetical protein